MTNDSDERIARLEHQTTRLRRWVLALGLALATAMVLGATTDPKELVLRKLSIVDTEGTARIVASASLDGSAGFVHFDRDGNRRIAAITEGGGSAHSFHYDRKGTPRVQIGTGGDASSRVVMYGSGGGVGWAETFR